MTSVPVGLLPTLLRNHARGAHAAEAAVGLLVEHGHWIERSDFQTECVGYDPDRRAAWVDWPAVVEFVEMAPCSPVEDRLLRFAAELAGHDSGSPLADLLCGLDDRSARLVVDAVRHALGAVPGATVPCDCGHRIPAVAYSAHQRSARHAGPGGGCVCGSSEPHPITAACLTPTGNGNVDDAADDTTQAES
ncbi:MAG: hypothetical protein ACRD2C_04215 [Acidimicrobiales bacterium]